MCTYWYTNLEHNRRTYPIDLYKRYDRTPEDFPKYDNYDAIEVSKVADIPEDYDGVMGVPITFIEKHCPDQFEILGRTDTLDQYGLKTRTYTTQESKDAYLQKFGIPGNYTLNTSSVLIKDGIRVKTYDRIFIRHKKT